MGRHRKLNTMQTAKGRVALVAVAAGAVSTAGMGGAAAATLHQNASAADFEMTADSAGIPAADTQGDATAAGSSVVEAPQILSFAEYKPEINIDEQLVKAIAANNERLAEDAAARAPQISTPAVGTLTSPFGPRWGAFHSGIDIANEIGTPILAMADGTVIDSGPASGYGQWIRIQHEDGTITVYGHMVTLDVAVGDHVTAGQKIAGMGNEGFSTGPHLHFEVHPGGGDAVDPVPYLAERGITV